MAKPKKTRKTLLSDNSLDLEEIHPLTENQSIFFENYDSGKSQALLGYPGTGKTFLSLYKAFEELNDPDTEYRQIIMVRSAVPTRDIGFLPGNLDEKSEVYELPYRTICTELFGRSDAYEILKKRRTLQFMTTSFIRGITLDRTIIIVDELQNMTAHEADSILTRVGNFSKILLCGDVMQRDLVKGSEKNIESFINVIQNMPNKFDLNSFNEDDIVRSDLVGDYIRAKYKLFPGGF